VQTAICDQCELYARARAAANVRAQISSLLALVGQAGLGMYGVSKAARDAYMRTLAVEQGDALRVLNYAPGPIDTRMMEHLIKHVADTKTQQVFTGEQLLMYDLASTDNRPNCLTPQYTADKLITLLERNDFESGAHIDVYDVHD
jgi:NAD(P)-dependent dehydrogenase (short-subunit alcohol dehydrogenase family)